MNLPPKRYCDDLISHVAILKELDAGDESHDAGSTTAKSGVLESSTGYGVQDLPLGTVLTKVPLQRPWI